MCAGLAALLLGLGFSATAGTLRQTEDQVVDILKDLTSRRAKNPIFRCYHLGRLKGVHDRLSGQLIQAQSLTRTFKKAEQLRSKIQQPLMSLGFDCDPDTNMTAPMTVTLAEEIEKSIRRLRSTGAEEAVVECFHAGRLKILSRSYREKLRRKAANNQMVSDEERSLLAESNRVVRARSQGCDRF